MENLEGCLKKLGDENWRELTNTVVYIRQIVLQDTKRANAHIY